MTKQEEIGEEIINWFLMRNPNKDRSWAYWKAKMLFIKLHSQGVVIKVDKELPKDKDCSGTRRAFDGTQERYAFDTAYFAAQQDMLKAGYVATEPLVKG